MKILFLSRYQFPYVKSGGTGVVVYELMKALKEIGHDIEHWTWDEKKENHSLSIEEMIGFKPAAKFEANQEKMSNLLNILSTNISMIRNLEQASKFDVVHVHTWEMFLAGITAKHWWGIPLVFTTHDIMVNDLPGEVLDRDLYHFEVFAEKSLCSEIDAVVAVSEENNKMFGHYYPEIADKIFTIPNGVNEKEFRRSQDRSLLRKYGVPDEPYVLFVGRTVKAKGLDYLVEAIEYISPSIPLVFALSTQRWDGSKYHTSEKYLKMIKNMQAKRGNITIILNEWNREVMANLYTNAAVTVMPSTYEPCGMVALESQACATPVITNNLGFMKESVIHGETGILLNFEENHNYVKKLAEAINYVYSNDDLRKHMEIKSLENALHNHTWKTRAEKHALLYEKLIKETQHIASKAA